MIWRRRPIERPKKPAGVPPIIGLVGRKRAGKDTVAERLVNEHGFVRMAFADKLKEALLALDPLVYADFDIGYGGIREVRLSEIVECDGWEGAKELPEVRKLLQNYGVAIREIDPNFWVKPVIWAARLSTQRVVITDVRFANEADAVERHAGKLIRVTRTGQDESDTHVSETQLAERKTWRTLANDGTIAALWDAVDDALTSNG